MKILNATDPCTFKWWISCSMNFIHIDRFLQLFESVCRAALLLLNTYICTCFRLTKEVQRASSLLSKREDEEEQEHWKRRGRGRRMWKGKIAFRVCSGGSPYRSSAPPPRTSPGRTKQGVPICLPTHLPKSPAASSPRALIWISEHLGFTLAYLELPLARRLLW